MISNPKIKKTLAFYIADYQYKSNLKSKPEKDFEYYNLLKENEYIALWTYKGYIIMNGKSFKNVNIFKKDRYDNSLSYIIDNTIYMPNYDEEHEYSKIIKLNIETHKIDSISLDNTLPLLLRVLILSQTMPYSSYLLFNSSKLFNWALLDTNSFDK